MTIPTGEAGRLDVQGASVPWTKLHEAVSSHGPCQPPPRGLAGLRCYG